MIMSLDNCYVDNMILLPLFHVLLVGIITTSMFNERLDAVRIGAKNGDNF